MNVLDNNLVLVLNSGWSVIDTKCVQQALTDMAGGSFLGLDIQDEYMLPTPWDKWIHLAVRDGDDVIHTSKLAIRIPRVILATGYRKVPVRRKSCNLRNVAEHYDNTDAFTGKKLKRSEMSMEHVVPRSKGGKDGWGNIVLAHRDLNSRRGDRPYEEVGLKPPKIKPAPKDMPVAPTIVNSKGYREWDIILGRRKEKV